MLKGNLVLLTVLFVAVLGLGACSVPTAILQPSISALQSAAKPATQPAAQAAAQAAQAVTPTPAAAPAPQVSTASSAFGAAQNLQDALEQIYGQVNPSVVTIRTIQVQQGSSLAIPFFGAPQATPQRQYQQALGSGFVWDMQGDIVTNNHVIAGASRISVTFADGTTVPGKVIGADPDSDLAVVKVNAPANELHPVQLADSSRLKVGQLAIAIGNPYGEQNTMTTGIISALGRSLPANGGNSQGPSYTIPDVIQTDAPINPGNSGGVLLNDQGQVVGVTSAIESPSGTSSGIGFAIPSEIVQMVVPSLIKTGHYTHPYLGIGGTTLTPSLAKAMNLSSSQRGALVVQVTPGSPADIAGLRGSTRTVTIDGAKAQVGGDLIIAFDGKPTNTFDDLSAYLAVNTQVGQTVTLTILRDGKEQTLHATLEARPGTQTQAYVTPSSASDLQWASAQ